MTDQKIQDRAARVKRLSNDERLLAAFAAMGRFPDDSEWTGSGTPNATFGGSPAHWLASAVDFALYQWPSRMSDACVALRKAVDKVEAEVEADAGTTPGWCWWKCDHTDDEYKEMAKKLVGHPVWDMTIDDLTPKEQEIARSRFMVNKVWVHSNTEPERCARQAERALRRMRTEDTLDSYQTCYNRVVEAIIDVLEGRSAPPPKTLPTCQMSKTIIDGHTVSQGPCGKPVHSAAPNRAGLWYCEECVATLMEGPNGCFQERKKAEIDQVKHDLDRPFKSRYLIGTGDLHGPKL